MKSNLVSVVSQEFTENEKAIARQNINAVPEAPQDGSEYVRKGVEWVKQPATYDSIVATKEQLLEAFNSDIGSTIFCKKPIYVDVLTESFSIIGIDKYIYGSPITIHDANANLNVNARFYNEVIVEESFSSSGSGQIKFKTITPAYGSTVNIAGNYEYCPNKDSLSSSLVQDFWDNTNKSRIEDIQQLLGGDVCDFYIDVVNGNDANNGKTISTAKKTTKAIVDAVNAIPGMMSARLVVLSSSSWGDSVVFNGSEWETQDTYTIEETTYSLGRFPFIAVEVKNPTVKITINNAISSLPYMVIDSKGDVTIGSNTTMYSATFTLSIKANNLVIDGAGDIRSTRSSILEAFNNLTIKDTNVICVYRIISHGETTLTNTHIENYNCGIIYSKEGMSINNISFNTNSVSKFESLSYIVVNSSVFNSITSSIIFKASDYLNFGSSAITGHTNNAIFESGGSLNISGLELNNVLGTLLLSSLDSIQYNSSKKTLVYNTVIEAVNDIIIGGSFLDYNVYIRSSTGNVTISNGSILLGRGNDYLISIRGNKVTFSGSYISSGTNSLVLNIEAEYDSIISNIGIADYTGTDIEEATYDVDGIVNIRSLNVISKGTASISTTSLASNIVASEYIKVVACNDVTVGVPLDSPIVSIESKDAVSLINNCTFSKGITLVAKSITQSPSASFIVGSSDPAKYSDIQNSVLIAYDFIQLDESSFFMGTKSLKIESKVVTINDAVVSIGTLNIKADTLNLNSSLANSTSSTPLNLYLDVRKAVFSSGSISIDTTEICEARIFIKDAPTSGSISLSGRVDGLVSIDEEKGTFFVDTNQDNSTGADRRLVETSKLLPTYDRIISKRDYQSSGSYNASDDLMDALTSSKVTSIYLTEPVTITDDVTLTSDKIIYGATLTFNGTISGSFNITFYNFITSSGITFNVTSVKARQITGNVVLNGSTSLTYENISGSITDNDSSTYNKLYWDNTNKGSAFIAEYEETSYSTIYDSIQFGLSIFCKRMVTNIDDSVDMVMLPLSNRVQNGVEEDPGLITFAGFSKNNGNKWVVITVDHEDVWTYTERTPVETVIINYGVPIEIEVLDNYFNEGKLIICYRGYSYAEYLTLSRRRLGGAQYSYVFSCAYNGTVTEAHLDEEGWNVFTYAIPSVSVSDEDTPGYLNEKLLVDGTLSKTVSENGDTISFGLNNPNNYIKGTNEYGGTDTANIDTITHNGFYTALSTATGVPNSSYDWFILHQNSSDGTSSVQTAYAKYSTDIIYYERIRISGTWGVWILRSSSFTVAVYDVVVRNSTEFAYALYASNYKHIYIATDMSIVADFTIPHEKIIYGETLTIDGTTPITATIDAPVLFKNNKVIVKGTVTVTGTSAINFRVLEANSATTMSYTGSASCVYECIKGSITLTDITQDFWYNSNIGVVKASSSDTVPSTLDDKIEVGPGLTISVIDKAGGATGEKVIRINRDEGEVALTPARPFEEILCDVEVNATNTSAGQYLDIRFAPIKFPSGIIQSVSLSPIVGSTYEDNKLSVAVYCNNAKTLNGATLMMSFNNEVVGSSAVIELDEPVEIVIKNYYWVFVALFGQGRFLGKTINNVIPSTGDQALSGVISNGIQEGAVSWPASMAGTTHNNGNIPYVQFNITR